MKYKITEEMKKKIWLYAIVIGIGVTIYFVYFKIAYLLNIVKEIIALTTPFILGFAIAFLLNKPMGLIETKLLGKSKMKQKLKRSIAAVLSILLGLIIVCSFLAILIPQLTDSIFKLVKAFPGYVEDFQTIGFEFLEKHGIDTTTLTTYFKNTDILKGLTDIVTQILPKMAKITYAFGSTLLNILLSIMAGLYMLMDKERLSGYVKKINYAFMPISAATYFHRMILATGDIFNNFIVGKAIDSLIIGIICYIGSLIFQFPYALLLAVIVGVTNMIPVFGPFIGAVPGIVILFIINPITAFYFALFILALQQFDGNILGPLILGDKLGLPSLGILFSVVVGGGLFGIVGMFIGVPCFAVIYMAVKEFVNFQLRRKAIDIQHVSIELEVEGSSKKDIQE